MQLNKRGQRIINYNTIVLAFVHVHAVFYTTQKWTGIYLLCLGKAIIMYIDNI